MSSGTNAYVHLRMTAFFVVASLLAWPGVWLVNIVLLLVAHDQSAPMMFRDIGGGLFYGPLLGLPVGVALVYLRAFTGPIPSRRYYWPLLGLGVAQAAALVACVVLPFIGVLRLLTMGQQ